MPALRHLGLCLALLLPLAAEWPAHSETLHLSTKSKYFLLS
jgi:hypothetical protein